MAKFRRNHDLKGVEIGVGVRMKRLNLENAEVSAAWPYFGVALVHRNLRNPFEYCGCTVVFDHPESRKRLPPPYTDVLGFNPLTLGGHGLRCPDCGHAGTIKEGRWVPFSASIPFDPDDKTHLG